MGQTYVQGALWKVFSCLCFAILNGLVKYISTTPALGPKLQPFQIIFFQYFFETLWLIPLLLRLMRDGKCRTSHLCLHLFRIALVLFATFVWYTSLGCLPLSLSVLLAFTGPLVTSIGAAFFLKERLHLGRITAIGLAIFGGWVLSNSTLLTQQSFMCFQVTSLWFVLLPLLSAAAFSTASLLTKRLVVADPSEFVIGTLALSMCIAAGLISIPFWVMPTFTQVLYLLLMGGVSLMAQWAMNKAFICSDVTFLLPFGTMRLVASALIGFFVFDEFFSWPFIVGGILIVCALYTLGVSERKHRVL